MNDPIGSKWRKWDLHFHTPRSFDYLGGRPTPETVVQTLLDASVSVVAVADHHAMDIEYIAEMRVHAGTALTVLPGIEFRSDYGGKPIHYIGIFPETADLTDLWDTLKGGLGLTPTHLEEKGGDERIYVKLADGYKVIVEELGGLISIHAGAKANSIEEIRNAEQFQQRLKLDITRDYVHILEVGQLKDVLAYLEVVYPRTGLDQPLIIGSDNHDIGQYSAPPCWIKADPTFTGLRQVLNEPRDRVFLGKRPPQHQALDDDPARFIQALAFSKRPGSSLTEVWFDGIEIQLNHGLVAIVGNQGSGKSALTDALGLLGRCPHEQSFAFLNEDQFRNPKADKAPHFDATLTWADGTRVEGGLGDRVPAGAIETVKYIPQFHLDGICDELRGGQGGKFEEELKSVIFSRIPHELKAKRQSLDDLIKFRTRDARESIEAVREELSLAAERFQDLEERATAAHRTSIEERLAVVEQKLKNHEEAKPKEVPPPEPSKGDAERESKARIAELDSDVLALDEDIKAARQALVECNERLEVLRQVRGSIHNLETEIGRTQTKLKEDLERLGIPFEDLVTVAIDVLPLDKREQELEAEKAAVETKLEEEGDKSLLVVRRVKAEEREQLQDALSRPAREFAAYQQAVQEWQTRRDELIGDESAYGTKVNLEKQLEDLASVPQDIEEALDEMIGLAQQILEGKQKVLTVSEEMYQPVSTFISEHDIAGGQFGLEFFVSFVPRDFASRFLDHLHQGRRGSFYGEAGVGRVEALLKLGDFSTVDGVLDFLRKVLHALTHDLQRKESPILIGDQLRRDFNVRDLLTYLLSLSYIKPQFELRWHGRPLEQLSPGERGTLLLIFFLLVDDAKIPLVIDQPEGNLDNQTVYELLVDCIKDAKQRRQIVIVTHNPNLAVVCDAEQVILADLDKSDGRRVTYTSGALENPSIGNRIVDVLEGTRPAIENRMAKYRIIFD